MMMWLSLAVMTLPRRSSVSYFPLGPRVFEGASGRETRRRTGRWYLRHVWLRYATSISWPEHRVIPTQLLWSYTLRCVRKNDDRFRSSADTSGAMVVPDTSRRLLLPPRGYGEASCDIGLLLVALYFTAFYCHSSHGGDWASVWGNAQRVGVPVPVARSEWQRGESGTSSNATSVFEVATGWMWEGEGERGWGQGVRVKKEGPKYPVVITAGWS